MHQLDKTKYIASLIRRNPAELVHVLSQFLATCKFRYLKRCVGKGTVVGSNTKMVNSANIRIGRDCWLQDMIYLRAGIDGRIEIGNRVAINSFVRMFGHGSIKVGDDAQIGPGTLITTTQHDFLGDMRASFQPVVIGKRAWIGANVTVLPGVTIGDFAVIGAGSVVTKSVPPSSIAVGVPARVIRRTELAEPKPDGPEANAVAQG